MKILYLENTANVAFNICRRLNLLGVEASILSHNPSVGVFDLTNIEKNSWIKTVPPPSHPLIFEYKYFHQILKSGADIIHCNSLSHRTSFALASRFFGNSKKVVVHCHGSELRYLAYMSKERWLLESNLRFADHVFVSTPDLLKYWKSAEFLPNPIDTEEFKPAPSNLDLHEGHDFAIFAPARQYWIQKGQDIFLKALKGLLESGYDCNMVMVNWGYDLQNSKALVARLGLQNNVTFVDPIHPKEMVNYLNASDIVFDQIGLNIMGLISLEALACNKPAISDFKYGWAYPSPPPIDYVKTVEDVVAKTKNCLESKRGNYRDWVLQNHSYRVIIPRLLKIYQQILSA